MKKAKVFEELAKNNKNLVMSGDSGEALIASLFKFDEADQQ